jgi:hypothetical protein
VWCLCSEIGCNKDLLVLSLLYHLFEITEGKLGEEYKRTLYYVCKFPINLKDLATVKSLLNTYLFENLFSGQVLL